MKSRTAILCLIAFSMVVCALQGVEHFMQARAIKRTLSVIQASQQEIDRVQDTLQAHYRTIETSIAVIVAQGVLIFLLIRGNHARKVT